MKNFEAQIAKHGLSEILAHIHALVAVVETNGTLLAWNRAFELHKASLPENSKLEDLFLDKDVIRSRLLLKKQERWVADLSIDKNAQTFPCDCMTMPLAENQVLFVAEHITADPTMQEKVQELSRQVDEFKNESEAAQKMIRRKEVEVHGVIAQAYELSQVDALTLLPNRRMLSREIQNEVLRAERYHTPFTLSLIDVDNFKKINDTHGHHTGDEVLKHIGQLLTNHIRHPDLAGRYGGEEFLILLPNSSARAAAEQASRLCRQVRETVIQIPDHVLQITISIGIAEFKHNTDTWETLLSRADTAMYEAKSTGRDRWVVSQ